MGFQILDSYSGINGNIMVNNGNIVMNNGNMGVCIVMGVPNDGWFTMENPSINGGYRGTFILGVLHMNH